MNLIQTLTSEARVLNPVHVGSRGKTTVEVVGGEALHNFFLSNGRFGAQNL